MWDTIVSVGVLMVPLLLFFVVTSEFLERATGLVIAMRPREEPAPAP